MEWEPRQVALGHFNVACSYFAAGQALERLDPPLRATHPDAPRDLLHIHAIELFLKAFLLSTGLTEDNLRKSFGHRTRQLGEEAIRLGLHLPDEVRKVLAFIEDTDANLEARYLRLGSSVRLYYERIENTCRTLQDRVGEALGAPEWTRTNLT